MSRTWKDRGKTWWGGKCQQFLANRYWRSRRREAKTALQKQEEPDTPRPRNSARWDAS